MRLVISTGKTSLNSAIAVYLVELAFTNSEKYIFISSSKKTSN
nr:MAG TPA: hypothetical protein [Caudoviricetes sp.]